MLFVDNKDSVFCILNPKKTKKQKQNNNNQISTRPCDTNHEISQPITAARTERGHSNRTPTGHKKL